ncbi:DUF5818 domain-containing protein [Nakamurella sp.]|uniref:DUF5818 domain-containing protein n=1 Tax=Nakamurella sp. TaxID=1869182 RepID=UPI00378373F1
MRLSAQPGSGRSTRRIVAGCLALLLVGCGAPAPPTGSMPPSGSGSTRSTPASPSSVPAPPSTGRGPASTPGPSASEASPPSEPSVPPAGMTVTGTVVEGAQPSCRNLQTDDDGRWTLTGEPASDLAIGAHVTVTGTPRPDLVSPCGRVLVVTSWR